MGNNRDWTCVVTYWFEKIMDASTFVLYYRFEIFCRSWFKFLIGNFTVVLIGFFFPDWEPKFLKQLGPHRSLLVTWWNWCKKWKSLINYKKSLIIFAEGIFSIESKFKKYTMAFIYHVTSRIRMVRGICDLAAIHVILNHKLPFCLIATGHMKKNL